MHNFPIFFQKSNMHFWGGGPDFEARGRAGGGGAPSPIHMYKVPYGIRLLPCIGSNQLKAAQLG
jgi:hypothetical protein